MTEDLQINIQDGGLGASTQNVDAVSAVIGCTSTGPLDRATFTSDLRALVATYGDGPGVEAAAYKIAQTGGPVLFARAAAGTAATIAGAASTGTGTGLAGTTITGTPVDRFDGVVEIVTGGTRGTAGITFHVSLDGGRTYAPETPLGTATTYSIPRSGLVVNFAAGTYVAGDRVQWYTTSPKWTTSDITTAYALINASPLEEATLHVAGKCSAAEAAAINTLLEASAVNDFKFIRAFVEADDVNVAGAESLGAWQTRITTEFAGSSMLRVAVGAGHLLITSPISGRAYRRGVAWAAAMRAAQAPAGQDLARVKTGPLAGAALPSATDIGLLQGYYDERSIGGLDASRFITATTRTGRVGVFLKNAPLMSPTGSDYKYVQHGRVMDIAARVMRDVLGRELSDDVPLDKRTGYILESAARAVEGESNAGLRDALLSKNFASDASAHISRTDNIITSGNLTATYSILPRGYIKRITGYLTFTNPAIQSAAA